MLKPFFFKIKPHLDFLLVIIFAFNLIEISNDSSFNNPSCVDWYIPTLAAIAVVGVVEILFWFVILLIWCKNKGKSSSY